MFDLRAASKARCFAPEVHQFRDHTVILGPSGCGKSFQLWNLVKEAVAAGHRVTVLDNRSGFVALTQELGGIAISASEALLCPDLLSSQSKVALVDFDASSFLGEPLEETAKQAGWAQLEPLLLARLGRGDLLALDELPYLLEHAASAQALDAFVRKAAAQGARVVVATQSMRDFEPWLPRQLEDPVC
jgi:hypothetical protein